MYGEQAEDFFDEVEANNALLPTGKVKRVGAIFQMQCMHVIFSQCHANESFQPNVAAINSYNAAYAYLTLVNQTLADGGDIRDGKAIFHRALNKTFHGNYTYTTAWVICTKKVPLSCRLLARCSL